MWSYLTLLGWSFAAATLFPLGSEPAVVYLIAQGHNLAVVVAVATLGNYLGACTTYWIGRGVRRGIERKAEPRTQARAVEIVAKYGAPALVLSWVPLIGDAIVAAAGVARMPFGAFSAWTIAGKLARYIAVAYGTRFFSIE